MTIKNNKIINDFYLDLESRIMNLERFCNDLLESMNEMTKETHDLQSEINSITTQSEYYVGGICRNF